MNRRTFVYLGIIILLALTWQAPNLGAAVSRLKTWASAETLTASDLNAEFNNVLNNGEDLGWPATKAKDMDGQSILMDGDQDTHITSDTDDRIDFSVGGFDGFRIDGTTASSVNGLDAATQSTGVAPELKSRGESNIGMELQDSNGNEMLVLGSTASAVNELSITNAATGNAAALAASGESNIGINVNDSNGNEILILGSTASAVNEVNITNAATGNPASIAGSGESNLGLDLNDSNGNEVVSLASTASAVNEVTVTNQVTGTGPAISATGDDSNVDLNLVPKGTGQVQFGGLDLAAILEGRIGGLEITINGTDADHDIDVAAGGAAADDQSAILVLSSSITKQIDASWAVGTDAGCLDGTESVTGTPDASTWYHIFEIRRSDTGVTDVLCSENASSPTLPTNYDSQRRIGSLLTDGSANITAEPNGLAHFGSIIQVVETQDSAVATGTTVMPYDDTIPQNTEGNEFLTVDITPTNANNFLEIEAVVNIANSNATDVRLLAALFQDSTANALAAAQAARVATANGSAQIVLRYRMLAGTTSLTTFKIRAGGSGAGTTTFNGSAGSRVFGGVMASSLRVKEVSG